MEAPAGIARHQPAGRMPVIFAAHGAPILLDTHDMRFAFRPGTPPWATEFDARAADALARLDVDALLDFQSRAPAAQTALPTREHCAPVLVAAGAAAGEPPRVSFPITGWWMDGAFTKRSVQFGRYRGPRVGTRRAAAKGEDAMPPLKSPGTRRRGTACVVVLLLAHAAGTLASGQPATTPGTALAIPKDYFTRPGTPLAVKPVLSADDAYDSVIGPAGGTMIAEGPDLTVYTLTIPPGALVEPIEIVMTPLASVGGLPFARGLVAGVHLAPSGTSFMQPARLSIRPGRPLPAGNLTPFAYGGQGDDLYLTPYRVEGGSIVVWVDHFSGQGLTMSAPQDLALQLARTPVGIRERLSQKTAEAIGKMQEAPPAEQGPAVVDLIERLKDAYVEQVLAPIEAQAKTNCTMGALYLVLTEGMERQLELLGKGKPDKQLSPLDSAYVSRCLAEQYELCLRTGDYRAIQMWYLGFQRQLQLLSGDTSPADRLEGKVNEYIRSCARYEVEFDSTLVMTSKLDATSIGIISAGPTSTSYAASVTAKVPVMLAAGTTAIEFTTGSADAEHDPAGIGGFGPLQYARYEASGSGSSALAVARDQQGAALGFSNACTFKGVSTRPGELTVLRVDPGFRNAENRRYPLVADTDTSDMAQAVRILRQLPQVGLLSPPRIPDPRATRMWISPKDVAEVERHTCRAGTGPTTTEDRDATNWLDQWQRWQPDVRLPGLDGDGMWIAGGAPVMAAMLAGAGWSSLTDRDARWHDSDTQRSPFGTTLIESTVILRHTPKPLAPSHDSGPGQK